MNPSHPASPELTTLEANNRVLVVDDNRMIHEDFQKILAPAQNDQLAAAEAALFPELGGTPRRRRFEIERAFQGLDGIEKMRRAIEESRPPAIAFLDIRMPPGIDGLETAVRLLELSDELQIVFCTAHSDYAWEDFVERLGYTDRVLFLKKPFCAIEVLQIASALSAKWSLGRAARKTLEEIHRIAAQRTEALRVANEKLSAEVEQRKAAQEQMLRAQRLECVGSLASGIAHDLNNLLSPIQMGADLLQCTQLAPRDAHLVETMQTATVRAAQLVSRMLTFARGRDEERTLVEVGGLVREVARLARETFPPHIQVRQELPAGLRLIHGHPTQFHQVLMNLCVNARDAMPEGGELRIAADNFEVDESFAAALPEAKPGEYLVLRVSDTGTGIPVEIRDKIFEPFFTTKSPEKGTGLGLATIAGIVREHGGFVRVESTVGRGTTFAIHLPAAVQCTLGQEDAPDASAPPPAQGELIMVVDDEAAIREATAATLETHGYRTLEAPDGAEALQLLARHRGEVRAVVTDLLMPCVDGWVLTRAARQLEPDLPVIFATAAVDVPTEKLAALKVPRPLAKPYGSRQLLQAVHVALRS
jgi:signal transduction histidine kinase